MAERKVCFMFGHADTSYDRVWDIAKAAQRHYVRLGVRIFIVGNRGNFDRYAALAIRMLKQQYKDISLMLLMAYLPKQIELDDGFNGLYYPELGNTDKRCAIVQANQQMINRAGSIICCVEHNGNARNLLDYARKKYEKSEILIENLAEE